MQEDLKVIYSWAGSNHMKWNDLKFQVLRLGPNQDLIESTTILSPDHGEVVEEKGVIKDLGIMVDRDLEYVDQLHRAVNKAKQKAAWVLRTFSSRYVDLMRTMWHSLVQCHLDYGNILWGPYNYHGEKWKWTLLESPLREFTRKAKGCRDLDYWSRLKEFKLTSTQRRLERYRILYTWKSLNGFAPPLGLEWSMSSLGRSGRTLAVEKVAGSTEGLKMRRRKSIQFEGVRLLNVLPSELRNFAGKVADFKGLLDNFLDNVPDEPWTDSLLPGAQDIDGKSSNSIYDWVRTGRISWKVPRKLVYYNQCYYVNSSYPGGEAQLNLL